MENSRSDWDSFGGKVTGLFTPLRHTYASALIRNNVSMKVVSTLCGHSSISITMKLYSHLLPDSTEGIAEALAGTMLGAGGSKTVAAG